VFDGVYRRTEGEPVFEEACAPTAVELQRLLKKIITRMRKVLILFTFRTGKLIGEWLLPRMTNDCSGHKAAVPVALVNVR
jgi:hypothetical protein